MQQKTVKTEEEKTHFLTPKKFEELIKKITVKDKCTHLDAIFVWCKRNEFDPQDIIPLLTTTLKNDLEVDGIELGLLKRKKSLF